MLKINEDGSCQRIGIDGAALPGTKNIDEFGPNGMKEALASIKKEQEPHEVNAVRGKFSKVTLDTLDSSDEDDPEPSFHTAPVSQSEINESEQEKGVKELKEDQKDTMTWKIPVMFIFINQTGRFVPKIEVSVEPNSSIEKVVKTALKAIQVETKDISDLQVQEQAHGVTKEVHTMNDTANPQGAYCITFQHKFQVNEPIVVNFAYTSPDGGIQKHTVQYENESVDSPAALVFKKYSQLKLTDLNSIKATKDGKEISVEQLLSQPGEYNISFGSKVPEDKSKVLYHFRVLSRASFDTRCYTVESPVEPRSFHRFWTEWAPTVGLKPENLHKLAEHTTGPLKDMEFNSKLTPFSAYMIAYTGEF
ncbi:unnamed protein product [Bursaphelenchus okinawaensis]|uniref:Uncharacterized protein n=1 Tax=Bursaphelenchus okinawaensis TaxID=465554 RepID=A0A811KIC5_9BILA|nr:unnamed protein product [Bursaphelenchus okinawaensis]CAG9103580.1 unnamed protein product [Bursaphelenchus okinawaensis]